MSVKWSGGGCVFGLLLSSPFFWYLCMHLASPFIECVSSIICLNCCLHSWMVLLPSMMVPAIVELQYISFALFSMLRTFLHLIFWITNRFVGAADAMTRTYRCICWDMYVIRSYKSIFSTRAGTIPTPKNMFLSAPNIVFVVVLGRVFIHTISLSE